MPNPNRSTSTLTPTHEPIATTVLLECAISARWFELSSLCDQYLPPDISNEDNDEPNPLFATILHTAILTASNHHTISIFGNTLPPSPSNDIPSEYCPYLTPFSIEDAETTKYRRICIGKLCRLDPSWISRKLCRTTVLHLAVRMRNPSLIDLLLRYNPNAARIVDDLGYVALHYAVYPPDESMLYQKAMSMQNARTNIANNSLIAPSDMHNAANMDVGGGTAGGVSFGVRTVERARGMLAGWTEMAMLSRHRVVSMSGKCIASKKGKKRTAASDGDVAEGHRRSMRLRANPTVQQQKTVQYLLFNNVFSSPSTLVRAMLFLKNVEDTSIPFIEAEKQSKSNTTFGEYPTNIHPELWKRMSRPWKSEGQRVSVVRRLIGVYAEGMEIQCQQDGDTPLIIAARTFQGGGEEDGEDEDLNDVWLMGGGIDAVVQPPAVAENNDNNNGEDAEMDSQTQNEVPGEEEADYEADLRGWVMKRDDLGEKPAAIQGRAEVNAVQENATQQQHENDPPIENNPEDLEVIRIMISAARNTNSSNDPFLISNLDGDTPLHAATRIGAARRLVTLLIAAQPLAAGRRAKDGNTPLHLMLRRCSHLAPEGVGGLASYDVEMVQLMVDVAGEGVMGFRNGDGRTPIHEAAYYGASPDVLHALASSPGGRAALLLRDNEGHTPLGAYCRHSADFYGMRVLVSHCPEAAAAMGDGRRLPIHRTLASFNLAVNVDVLNLLGNAYPRGLLLKDDDGMTALALLCESYRGPINVDLPKLLSNQTTLGRCLSNKVMLMARYLILGGRANKEWNISQMRDDDDGSRTKPKERLLHATLRDLASSEEIVELVTIIDPSQLHEADEEGNTPLHLCCLRESGCTEYTLDGDVLDMYGSDEDSVFHEVNDGSSVNEDPIPLETSEGSGRRILLDHGYDPSASFIPILHSILRKNLSAARVRNNDGKFPFTILVERGASWEGGGIDQVFKANPAAIFSYNLSNALVATAMGRVSQPSETYLGELKDEEEACLGAMFELLRGKPTVLEGANVEMLSDPETLKQRGKRRSKRLLAH